MAEDKDVITDPVKDLEAALAARDVRAASVTLDALYERWESLPDAVQARLNALESVYLTLVASEFGLTAEEGA